MLYVTTRSKSESYTAYRTLFENRAPDGGFFLPFRMPVLEPSQIAELKKQGFGEAVAYILNLFFSTGLSAWDIDCCIGKAAARIIAMPHRVLLAQLWDNPRGDYAYICDTLYEKLCGKSMNSQITDWASTAIRIAVLFGLASLLHKMNISTFDVAVNTGDFAVPMAVWYARKMGLPVGCVLCACNENSGAWDFLHRGEINTGTAAVRTSTPDLDFSNPPGLERLIFAVYGFEETQKYLMQSSKGRLYQVRPDMIQQLNQGMFASVIGNDRVEAVINSVYRSNNCILDPYTAVSYGSLQDYRAKTGESCPTVLLWDRNPMHYLSMVEKATGLTKREIENTINQL